MTDTAYIPRGKTAQLIAAKLAGRLRRKDMRGKAEYNGTLGITPVKFALHIKAYNEKWHRGKEGMRPNEVDALCSELAQLVTDKLPYVYLTDWERRSHSEPLDDTITGWHIYVKAAYAY